MKALPQALAERILLASTTLCRCWVLHRADGISLGFTDHDQAIEVDDVTCEPQTALEATEAVSQLGFAPDNTEIAGALIDARVGEDDIRNGLYDGARVETWLVDWTRSDARLLQHIHLVGEIASEDGFFRAEMRGRTSSLDKLTGRAYDRYCDAELGDARCGVNLVESSFTRSGAVSTVFGSAAFSSADLGGFESGWYCGGSVLWTSGHNAGLRHPISPVPTADPSRVQLWSTPQAEVAVGDTFEITAGCDKRFATCRSKFDNGVNYRGFPHIPGDDFAFSYARNGTVHDGSPLVKDE